MSYQFSTVSTSIHLNCYYGFSLVNVPKIASVVRLQRVAHTQAIIIGVICNNQHLFLTYDKSRFPASGDGVMSSLSEAVLDSVSHSIPAHSTSLPKTNSRNLSFCSPNLRRREIFYFNLKHQ